MSQDGSGKGDLGLRAHLLITRTYKLQQVVQRIVDFGKRLIGRGG